MGVKKLYLVNSYRVEKRYWQTPLLEPAAMRAQLILGLEQEFCPAELGPRISKVETAIAVLLSRLLTL